MSKRNLGTMETDSQNMEEHPEKLSRSNAPVASPTAINQLPTTSRQSTSNQGSSDKVPSLQVPTIKISCAELDSVPEDEYGENGFARIDIEQEIGGQFDTLKFLGFGAYATIWLVKNRVDGKYEALKITKSNPDYEETVMREVQFMNYMIKLGTHENIVEFLGFTEINVDRAIHQVLRFEVLGPNLDEVLQSELKFHPDVLKNMIKQLLKAVEYIHRQHIIHMDIKTENIMFAICDEDIQMMAIRSYASNNIYHLDLTSADSKFTLKLADFGLAVINGVSNEREFPPADPFRAPESIMTFNIDFPIDMWSVGCTIYEMVTRKQFISCDVPNGHSYLYLYEMAHILGPIPKAPFNYRMRPKYHDFFEEEDFIDHGNPDTHKIFVDAATKHNYLNAKDAECFSKFVSRFFEYDPKERVTAKEALDHDFLLTNEDKSVKIETADRPGTLSVDSSEASTSQPCSSASGN